VRPRRETVLVRPRDREALARAARSVFGGHPEVVAAWLHGSAVRGELAADLDVAVLLEPEARDARLLDRIASELREEADVPLEIDLRPFGGTSPRFRISVLRDGALLFERDSHARVRAEARAMVEWLDFKPVWERMRARMRDRWAGG